MPISALISGVLAGASQSATNQSNEDIARETNALNYKIWQASMAHDKEMFDYQNQANIDMFNLQNQANIDFANMQNQWQLDQWNRENEYNSAINQRKRLEEAGLNPYLMMNGGSAGTASSVKSAPFQTGNLSTAHMNKSQAPTMQGYHYVDPLQSAVNTFINAELSFSQARNQNANAGLTEGVTPYQVNMAKSDSEYRDYFNSVNYSILDKQDKLLADDVLIRNMTFYDRVRVSALNRVNMQMDNDMKSVALKYFEPEKIVSLDIMAVDLLLRQKQLDLTDAQIKGILASAFRDNAQGSYFGSLKKGLDMDNEVRENSLTDEKRAIQYGWKATEQDNFFSYDTKKKFNREYQLDNDAKTYAERLYDNAKLSLVLSGKQLNFDVDDYDNHGFSRSFGNKMRGLFGGWNFPDMPKMGNTYNNNFYQNY